MGTAPLLHEQVHDPSEKKSERGFQDGHHGSFRELFAEALFFFLAIVRLVGEVIHHHGDADCRNDAESRGAKGRNYEPSPQHAQGVAVEDGAEDHQKSDTDDAAKNSQYNHFSTSSKYWIAATLDPLAAEFAELHIFDNI